MGNNCKKVDITANGVLNDLAIPNMNTYSMNSTTNSSTLFSMEVDEIGNMTKFNGYDFNWNGRRLESISQDGVELISYKYNIDGQRVSKTIGNTTTEYFYNGGILAGQKTGNDVLIFMYDNNGDVFGFEYNGTPYYYIKNAQNDVYMIVDETGVAQVLYMYDAWGRIGCYDATNFGLATINPLMYRSYYLDVETGYHFYYLNSRYYLADLGRFVSADSYVQTGQGMLDKNMFAYCGNNPVNRTDSTGEAWYHWALGAAIVVGCAAATVITAGGFGFAMTALGFASMGVTVGGATGACAMATVASATFLATSAAAAALNSNSIDDFKNQGSWLTVAGIGFSATMGGYSGYFSTKSSKTSRYSSLSDPDDVAPGKDFTASQKQQIIDYNRKMNGGVVRSDYSGIELTKPMKSMKGITPDPNEWQIDHIFPKSLGGTNSFSNAQVLSRAENRIKWDY